MATETLPGDIASAQAYCKAALLLASELEDPLGADDSHDGYLRLQALIATLMQIESALESAEVAHV